MHEAVVMMSWQAEPGLTPLSLLHFNERGDNFLRYPLARVGAKTEKNQGVSSIGQNIKSLCKGKFHSVSGEKQPVSYTHLTLPTSIVV